MIGENLRTRIRRYTRKDRVFVRITKKSQPRQINMFDALLVDGAFRPARSVRDAAS